MFLQAVPFLNFMSNLIVMPNVSPIDLIMINYLLLLSLWFHPWQNGMFGLFCNEYKEN